MSSIFTKIIRREIPSEIVFENEKIIAFKDISPQAPIHILLVPKKEIPHLQALEEQDFSLISEIISAAQRLAEEFDIQEGYRLVTNCGKEGGQEIFHLHFHLLGGKPLCHKLG